MSQLDDKSVYIFIDSKIMSSHASVKTLSLEDYQRLDSRQQFVDNLLSSLAEFGFVGLRDHGISESLLDRCYGLNRELFELPLTNKLAYTQKQLGHRGYTAFGKEHAKDNPQPDLKEFWHIGPQLNSLSPYVDRYPPNVWPDELDDFKETMLELYSQLNRIALQILEAIGIALSLPANYFESLIQDGNSVLRLIHYPPVLGMNTQQQMRAAAHADINLMTLLVGASGSGLQLLDKNSQWLDVVSKPGEIIIDTGDMMALITGGVLPSTHHRVINPESDSKARYSMPFFVHPHGDAELSCFSTLRKDGQRYTSITASEFLQQRLTENGL